MLLFFWDLNHNEKKVSEAEACRLASAFCSELSALKADVESQSLLNAMSRLDQTGHSPRLFQEFDAVGLVAPIKERLVRIEAGMNHPTLPFRNIVECLSESGKLQTLLGDDFWILDTLQEFWGMYRGHFPNHPIYSLGADRLKNTLPLLAHADEGTGKKKTIMILQIQPVHGRGSSRNLDGGLNFVGVSIATRFLYSVMTAKVYSGKNGQRLDKLVGYMAKELEELFYSPIELKVGSKKKTLYFSCIGLKGDWPALVKLGKLERHFGHNGATSQGICHLCKAGQPSYNYADFSYEAMLRAHRDVPLPWNDAGALTMHVPQDQSRLPEFLKIDVFHTFHKGILADLASNGIET